MPKSATKQKADRSATASERSKRCEACGRKKRTGLFRMVSDKKPYKYADKCLSCESKEGEIPSDPKEFAKQKVDLKAETHRDARVRRELAKRELARRHLLQYIFRYETTYLAGWVHQMIAEELEQFLQDSVDGKSPRLMIFMPPRHGKTMMASDYFVSWALGKHPWMEIISSSYSSTLPIKASRRIRSRMQLKSHQKLFENAQLKQDSRNVEHWNTTAGGQFLAAGVGGGVTGHGAHIFIIDDPVKDAEEADSETVRENHWDWWSSTASTRVAPGGGVLVIQTRWHDDDLSGRMLRQENEEREEGAPEDELEGWKVISFPALAEEDEYRLPDNNIVHGEEGELHPKAELLRRTGEALHPDRWPVANLKRKRRSMQPRHWSALYQQNPVPDEGITFTKDMFITRPQRMGGYHTMKLLAAWDLAIAQKQHNDWTVGVVGGLDMRGNLIVLDMVRGRWGAFKICEAILDMYQKYPEMDRIGIERGQLEQAIRDPLNALMAERSVHPVFDDTLNPIQDKEKRAKPLQGMMQAHKVLFPPEAECPWVSRIKSEMLRFPAGVHEDTVDAMAWLARMAYNTTPPREPKPSQQRSWKEKLKTYTGSMKDPMAV